MLSFQLPKASGDGSCTTTGSKQHFLNLTFTLMKEKELRDVYALASCKYIDGCYFSQINGSYKRNVINVFTIVHESINVFTM